MYAQLKGKDKIETSQLFTRTYEIKNKSFSVCNFHKGNGEGVDAGEFALFYISDITSFATKCISSDCVHLAF